LSFLDTKKQEQDTIQLHFYDMLVRTFFSKLLAFFFLSALSQGAVNLLGLKICIQVIKLNQKCQLAIKNPQLL